MIAVDQPNVSSSIADIICEELQDDALTLQADTELASIPGWDSVTMSCVMIAIERTFGFEFDGNDLDRLTDLDSLVKVVARKQTAAVSP